MQNYILMATLRIKNELTQQEISNILGVSIANYKEYETGRRLMNLHELNILSNFYDVSINALLGITNNLKCVNLNKNINYKMLAFYLKYIRRKNNYTQKQLASKFKVDINSISRYENKPWSVSIFYLKQLANEFHISIDYICDKTKEKEVF